MRSKVAMEFGAVFKKIHPTDVSLVINKDILTKMTRWRGFVKRSLNIIVDKIK